MQHVIMGEAPRKFKLGRKVNYLGLHTNHVTLFTNTDQVRYGELLAKISYIKAVAIACHFGAYGRIDPGCGLGKTSTPI